MKHIPGPWKIIEKNFIDDEPLSLVPTEIHSYCGFPVVSRKGGLAPDQSWYIDEIRANARLIAASPDLFELLKKCLSIIDSEIINDIKYPLNSDTMLTYMEDKDIIKQIENKNTK